VNHELITSVLALAGTLLVALLGFYQWRKQNANPNRAANAATRRDAFEGLWERLEQINMDLRKTRSEIPSLEGQLHSINEYFLGHSLYFDDQDQVTINNYVGALHRVRAIIDRDGDDQMNEQYRLTGPIDIRGLEELRAATRERSTWGSAWRQRDYDFFTSAQFREILAQEKIKLITWRELDRVSTGK